MAHGDRIVGGLKHDRRIGLVAAPDQIERAVAGMLLVHDALEDHVAAQRKSGFAEIGNAP